ncbi:MAG: tetratricopeptide (TPR) repeat protein [Phycisphaerales bacterium]|jgi:tetratricopeptide (TPR) repeat protein
MNANTHLLRTLTTGLATALVLASLGACGSPKKTAADPQRADSVRVVTARPTKATAPERAAASETRGDLAISQGDLSRALVEFERAIATNPELASAYIKAGRIYQAMGDLETAAARYARAAELDPLSFDAHYMHGLTLQVLERHEDAVRAYLRALAVRPDDADANTNLATAFLQIGRPLDAQPYALRAVRLSPNSGEARINLAACYVAMERFDDAVVEYQQAAELVTEPDEQLLLSLADALGRTKRYAEMAATLDQLVRTSPSAIAYERLGSALFRLKQYEPSLSAFLAATEQDPEHYPAFNGVSVCLLNQYLWSKKADRNALFGAVDALRTSLRLNPDQPKILELLRRYGPQATLAG